MHEPIISELRVRAKAVFVEAIEASAAERPAVLERACKGDARLAAEVRALLSAYDGVQTHDHGPTRTNAEGPRPQVAEPVEDDSGKHLGPYTLVERIGEGGFGVVYRARQDEPVRRIVAIKIIKAGMDSRQVIARFEQERHALGLMDHPSVARVLDAGTTGAGRPFFVMEFVAGVPLTEYCDSAELDVDARIALFIAVCEAVQHAHQKGLIHRDLKPSNVLVALADGRATPKVIDFGIAKATRARLTEKTFFTEAFGMLGTPEYMSPEQAESGGVDVDTRTDVYSLGAMLYELLTGTAALDRDRLRAASFTELQRMIREEEPRRPSTRAAQVEAPLARRRGTDARSLSRSLHGELDWIVLKAMEKDRARRYESASGLALDLERYLRNEPVAAGPPSAAYRLRKLAARHRAVVLATGLVLLALIIGLGLAVTGFARASRERDDAQRQAYRASLAAAAAAIDGGRPEAARQHLSLAEGPLQGWEWSFLDRQLSRARVTQKFSGPTTVRVKGSLLTYQRADGGFRIRDMQSGLESTINADDRGDVRCFEVNYTRDRLLVRFFASSALFDLPSGRLVRVFDESMLFDQQAFAADGRSFILTDFAGSRVVFIDSATGLAIRSIPGAVGRTRQTFASLSPDGAAITLEGRDGGIVLIDSADGRVIWEGEGVLPRFSPDGTRVLAVEGFPGETPLLAVRDRASGAKLGVIDLSGVSIDLSGTSGAVIAQSASGELLAVQRASGQIRVFDARTLKPIARLAGPAHAAGVGFSENGKSLYAVSGDGVVVEFAASSGDAILRVGAAGTVPPRAIAISADAGRVYCGDWGRQMAWSARTGEPEWTRFHSLEYIEAGAFKPDGSLIAVVGDRGTISLLESATGDAVTSARPRGFAGFGSRAARSVDWNSGGDTIAVGWGAGGIDLLESTSLNVLRTLSGPHRGGESAIERVRFAPGGRTLLAAIVSGQTQVLSVWNLDLVEPTPTHTLPLDGVAAIAWDPRGLFLAAAHTTGVTIFNGRDLTVARLIAPPGQCTALAFSPDSSRLAGGLSGGGLVVWSAKTGDELLMIPSASTTAVEAIRFSSDGSALVASSPSTVVERCDSVEPDEQTLLDREEVRRARSLIDSLRPQFAYMGDVILRVQADRSLAENLRARAVRLAGIIGDHAASLNNGALLLARPGATEPVMARALRESEIAMARSDDPFVLNVRAIVLYRASRFTEALAMLDRAVLGYRASRPAFDEWTPAIGCYRAMILHRLGQPAEAAACMKRVRERTDALTTPADGETDALLAEADALLAER